MPAHLKHIKFESTPNIYLLVYDSYQDADMLKKNYGIENFSHEQKLKDMGFRIQKDIYSIAGYSIGSMSKVLELGGSISSFNNLLLNNGYDRYYVFRDHYFTRNGFDFFNPTKILPNPISDNVPLDLLHSIAKGQLKAVENNSTSSFSYNAYLKQKKKYLRIDSDSPRFFYSHTGPGHAQFSGKCLENEIDLFSERLAKANEEMLADINNILEKDDDPLILIMGDHGPYLKGDCQRLRRYGIAGITRELIEDRFSTFLAIKWPEKYVNTKGRDMEKIQDVIYELIFRLSKNAEINNYRLPLTASTVIKYGKCGALFRNGKIVCGKDANQSLRVRY
ncbi:MAG: hypothetical protein R3B45_14220 [Bdellovibrionota bacterium]